MFPTSKNPESTWVIEDAQQGLIRLDVKKKTHGTFKTTIVVQTHGEVLQNRTFLLRVIQELNANPSATQQLRKLTPSDSFKLITKPNGMEYLLSRPVIPVPEAKKIPHRTTSETPPTTKAPNRGPPPPVRRDKKPKAASDKANKPPPIQLDPEDWGALFDENGEADLSK